MKVNGEGSWAPNSRDGRVRGWRQRGNASGMEWRMASLDWASSGEGPDYRACAAICQREHPLINIV